MNADTEPDTEIRPYSPAEVGRVVSLFREAFGWSQETLAELSRLTVRTIQRVEAGEPSSLDTRRALASAFQLDDIDTFNKSHEFTTPGGAAKAKAEFDRKFVSVDVRSADGRSVVRALSACGPYRLIHSGTIGRMPREAEDLYACVVDFLSDVLDVMDLAKQTELLGYGDQIEEWVSGMRLLGFEIAIGTRKVGFGSKDVRLPGELLYVMSIPIGCGAGLVAVPREIGPGSI